MVVAGREEQRPVGDPVVTDSRRERYGAPFTGDGVPH
uniref:Uncharacterized protein n=1 Tax=Arundo donax TaxID=35708 RepID=A0A0A9C1U5_ARUDO